MLRILASGKLQFYFANNVGYHKLSVSQSNHLTISEKVVCIEAPMNVCEGVMKKKLHVHRCLMEDG